jgi:hypothetical protein
MDLEIAGKSDLRYVKDAVDILRKSPGTSKLDIKSLRILEYDYSSYVQGSEANTRFKLGFSVSGEPHVAEFIIRDKPYGLISHDLLLDYAVLDGHYDLLANMEIW